MTEKAILFNDNDNALLVKKLDEIVYMESLGCKTKTCFCDGKELLIKKYLSQVEESLPSENFFKIHKSFIININYLKGINVNTKKSVLLNDGIEIKIAHRKYKDFMEFVKNRFVIWQ